MDKQHSFGFSLGLYSGGVKEEEKINTKIHFEVFSIH